MTSKKSTSKTSVRGDVREIREESESRESRESQERTLTDDRELSDTVRLEMVRGGEQSILPNIPDIEGFHVCWLSTTNGNDPIHRRVQLGYQAIRADEIPNFSHSSIKSGEWQGCVGVNEMIAFKLPLRLYQKYMAELHYHAPAREEQQVNEIYEQAQRDAAAINTSAQTLLTDEGKVRRNLLVPEPVFE